MLNILLTPQYISLFECALPYDITNPLHKVKKADMNMYEEKHKKPIYKLRFASSEYKCFQFAWS